MSTLADFCVRSSTLWVCWVVATPLSRLRSKCAMLIRNAHLLVGVCGCRLDDSAEFLSLEEQCTSNIDYQCQCFLATEMKVVYYICACSSAPVAMTRKGTTLIEFRYSLERHSV